MRDHELYQQLFMSIARRSAVRVVCDTSVWISALLWTGLPHQLLKRAEIGKIIYPLSRLIFFRNYAMSCHAQYRPP